VGGRRPKPARGSLPSHFASAMGALVWRCPTAVELCNSHRAFRHSGRKVLCGWLTTPEWVCQTDGIRTTLDIDDDLMRTLLDRLPGRSKTDAIEHAIEVFLADDAVDRLKSLAGTMEIEDLSHELRMLDRTT